MMEDMKYKPAIDNETTVRSVYGLDAFIKGIIDSLAPAVYQNHIAPEIEMSICMRSLQAIF